MKVVVCRVGAEPVVEEIEPGLKAMQAVVGGYIERVQLDASIDLWCNEEGRIIGLLPNRLAHANYGPQPIHGDFFIAKYDGDETRGLSAAELVVWLEEVANWPQYLGKDGQ